MQARIFTFRTATARPEWNGDVRSTVELDRDGAVRVTTQLVARGGAYEDAVTQFDTPTGWIESHSTPRGTTRYQYVYPGASRYPGFSRTVREAAQHAATHAADLFIRRLYGKAPMQLARTITPSFTDHEARELLELLDANSVGRPAIQCAAIALRDAIDTTERK